MFTPEQLVGAVLAAFCRRYPTLDWDLRDELRAEAGLAYAECLTTFDPEVATIVTHAWPRMFGAMLDYLRRNSPWSRHAWNQIAAGETPTNKKTGVALVPRSTLELRDDLESTLDVADLVASQVDVRDALHRLHRAHPREAFVVLRRLAGYTLVEIAEDLGVSDRRVNELQWVANRRLLPAFRDGFARG